MDISLSITYTFFSFTITSELKFINVSKIKVTVVYNLKDFPCFQFTVEFGILFNVLQMFKYYNSIKKATHGIK